MEADLIISGLFLGNVCAARSEEFLKSKGITSVLTVMAGESPSFKQVLLGYFPLYIYITEYISLSLSIT